MNDNDILDLFFARQEQALREAELKYGKRLFHTSFNILRNSQDAEECVSDTLLKAWESIPPARPDILGAFLSKIARNISLNRWKAQNTVRRGGGEVELLLSELEDCIPVVDRGMPEKAFEAKLVTEVINNCLAAMEQSARTTFVLRYFHGESIRDISTRFDMSESKVKSLLFRARKKLGAYLEKEGVTI